LKALRLIDNKESEIIDGSDGEFKTNGKDKFEADNDNNDD